MKRALLLLVLLLPAVGSAQVHQRGLEWTCSVDGTLDSAVLCVVAPEPGMRRYITGIVAQSNTATAAKFNVYYGTGTVCNTGTTGLFPTFAGFDSPRFVAAGNAAPPTAPALPTPLVVPGGNDLCVQGNEFDAVTVDISGYVAP